MAAEAKIEQYLVAQVKQAQGKAYKWVSPSNVGVPDRLIVMPRGNIFFIEVKAPHGKTTPIQRAVHNELQRLGARVYVVYSKEDIEEVLGFEKELAAITLSRESTTVLNPSEPGSVNPDMQGQSIVHGYGPGEDGRSAQRLAALLD
jgi:hypothetical protein